MVGNIGEKAQALKENEYLGNGPASKDKTWDTSQAAKEKAQQNIAHC